MTKLQKWVSLFLCVCMLGGIAAFAAAEVTQAVASTAVDLQDDTLVASVNGENILWADIKDVYENLVSNYGSYYDMTTTANISLFRAVALENYISEVLILQQAKATGLDQLSEEEIAALHASADADWASAMDNYIQSNYAFTEETTDEEKEQARVVAEAYYGELGYTQEILRDTYVKYDIFDHVERTTNQDAVITDEEIEADYQAKVARDQELYGNDIAAYVDYNSYVEQMDMYAMLYGSANDMEYSWYKPAGFRAVKHILLSVDEALMNGYKELQSKLEEQQDAEAAAVQGGEAAETIAPESTEATAPEATSEPVTQEDVDKAKADILASMADTIDEINQKLIDGASFDELIAIYNTDPGMQNEPYMTSGYEVALASSNYVPEFVDAAFSMDSVGDISAPYLSDYGVHILKYIADVPAGPVEMTPEQREASRATLLAAKQSDMFSAKLQEWRLAAQIDYSGVIPSMAEIEKLEEEAAENELEALLEEDADEPQPEESVPEEAAPQEVAQPES